MDGPAVNAVVLCCPACGYPLPPAVEATCPECGRRWRGVQVASYWRRQLDDLRRTRRSFLHGAAGMLVWACSLAGTSAMDGDVSDTVPWILAFVIGAAVSGAGWISVRCRMGGWAERPFRASRWLSVSAQLAAGVGWFFGLYSVVPLSFMLMQLAMPWAFGSGV